MRPAQPAGADATRARRFDPRLVPGAIAAWAAAGLLLGAPPAVSVSLALVAVSGGLFLARRVGSGRRPGTAGVAGAVAAAVLICCGAAAVAAGLRVAAARDDPLRRAAAGGTAAEFEIVVGSDPHVVTGAGSGAGPPGAARVLLRGRVEALRSGGRVSRSRSPVLVVARGGAWARLVPSQRIRAYGRAVPAREALLAAVVLARGAPVVLAEASPAQRAAESVRAGLREAAARLPPDAAGLLPGLVLGDTREVGSDLSEAMRDSGLAHLTAASGANLAIIVGALLALTRLVRLPPVPSALTGGVGVVWFVIVARPSPSVLRAAVMGAIVLVALASGRERDGVSALAVAVLGLVLVDPGLARSYGFALSVLATAGILVGAPVLADRLAGPLPRRLGQAVAVAASAQLACAPVLVLLTAEVSLVAIPANLAVAPAVAPATLLGALAAAAAPLAPGVAELLVRPAGLAVGWIAAVARAGAAAPFATLPWWGGVGGVVLAVAALVAGIAVLRTGAVRRLAAVAVVAAVLAVVAVRCAAPDWPPPGWRLVACDVGQGDALVLNAGAGGAVVVDAGPDPGLVAACLARLRVDRVRLVVLTHFHADHVAGLPGVLRRHRPDAALVSPLALPAAEAARALAALDRRGVAVRTAVPGERFTAGPLAADVLGPDPAMVAAARGSDGGTGPNDASVVIVARWPSGPAALLAGDTESAAQARLRAVGGLPRVDVVKIAHHGSAVQDPAFLVTPGARVAVISVGAGNPYGHPAAVTLAALARRGIRDYRTDVCGDVAVGGTSARLLVSCRGRAAR